jgi:hypothetical protein
MNRRPEPPCRLGSASGPLAKFTFSPGILADSPKLPALHFRPLPGAADGILSSHQEQDRPKGTSGFPVRRPRTGRTGRQAPHSSQIAAYGELDRPRPARYTTEALVKRPGRGDFAMMALLALLSLLLLALAA